MRRRIAFLLPAAAVASLGLALAATAQSGAKKQAKRAATVAHA